MPQASATAALCLVNVTEGDQREQHDDEHDIEQARGEGRHGKAPKRVQNAGIERHQRHAEQKRQRDAGKQDGEVEFGRVVGKARGEQQHEPRHDELAEEREDDEGKRQSGKGLLGEGAGPLLSALAVKALGEQRNEGGVEGAFGEQAAEQIGDAEGDEEGVGDRPGAQHRGDQHVADETEHAAPDGHRPDSGECAVKCHAAQALTPALSLPAKAGNPVIPGIAGEYWIARSSRAMTSVED